MFPYPGSPFEVKPLERSRDLASRQEIERRFMLFISRYHNFAYP